MITFWNQREVYVGYITERLKDVLEILIENGIPYKCRVFSDSSVHFFSTKILSLGLLKVTDDRSKIYHVFVHARDHAKACQLLSGSPECAAGSETDG